VIPQIFPSADKDTVITVTENHMGVSTEEFSLGEILLLFLCAMCHTLYYIYVYIQYRSASSGLHSNPHIRMISKGSCDTEDSSNNAENSQK